MTNTQSWIYQGRQSHGWFGNGTAPDQGATPDQNSNPLFRPVNIDQRVDYASYSIIIHIPRKERGLWNAATGEATRDRLKTAITGWYGASTLSREAFRARFLAPFTSDATVDHLRSAARGIVEGRTYDDLAVAGEDLATAAQEVGVSRWPGFVRDASTRATNAAAHEGVPDVMNIAVGRDPITGAPLIGPAAIAGAISGGIIGGFPKTPSNRLPEPISSGLAPAIPLPPEHQGETPSDVLKPEGQNVGEPGDSSRVRILPGGREKAKELFDRLTQGKNGEDITPKGHVGQVIRLPDGSIIGIRGNSKSGPPTIDIRIRGLGVQEIKFPEEK